MLQTQPQSAAAPPAPAVRLRSGRLAFGDRLLFDGLSLELAAGKTTCLLGPSGVGKTSLLRLVAGLAESALGEVTADDGQAIAGRVAFMAQQDLLLPWSTVLGNVLLGPRLRGTLGETGTEARATTLVAQVGLAGHEGDHPAQLSAGMRQRVALARTLMEDRPVVLMDEPFSALDAITRYELQDLAARLLAGRTVFLVTHDPMEALRLGHRVHVLAGRSAQLDGALEPEGQVPRGLTEPNLLALQGELLRRLSEAHQAA
jgi:putative hydroxymethylpyrimidine transport system ATP-binding protein